jgi:hypothetical protein
MKAADPTLAVLAEMLDDLEHVKNATKNRRQAMLDPKMYGTPEAQVGALDDMVQVLTKLEHEAILELQRRVRLHPLYSWIKKSRGVGEKQGARLLSAIGDPYIHGVTGEPRTVSQLWAYCGYHTIDGIAARRKRGVKANWSDTAKKRAYLVAEKCMMAGGDYRDVYDKRKANTEGRLHLSECVRCGPSGKPALPGSEWSAGHRHADALRVVSKEILKDLWKAARDVHQTPS